MNKRNYFIILLLLLPLLLWRDYTPNNELRYLSIANDALDNGRFFTFYYDGALYADKPPLYLWIVMLCKKLLGDYSMWFLGLCSLIPALLVVRVMDRWCRDALHPKGRRGAAYALMTSGIFAGAAVVVRMDMLMVLFIVLALEQFYRIYSGDRRRRKRLLLAFYIFMGLFTKGPVGLLLPPVVMVVFLAWKGELRSYFRTYLGWREWGLIVLLSGLWIGATYHEGGDAYLQNLLVKQTVGRAISGFHHNEPWWYYGKEIWIAVAPWSLFYLTTIVIAIWKRYLRTDLEKLFICVVGTTLVLLSLSSSKLSIYLLPLVPFMSYLSVVLCRRIEHRKIYWTIAIPAVLFVVALPAGIVGWLLYLRKAYTVSVSDIPWGIIIGLIVLCYFGIKTLIVIRRGQLYRSIYQLGLGILATACCVGFSLHEINPYIGFKAMSKVAKETAEQHAISRYGYYKFRGGNDLEIYLEKPVTRIEKEAILNYEKEGNLLLVVKEKDLRKMPAIDSSLYFSRRTKVGEYILFAFPPKGVPLP